MIWFVKFLAAWTVLGFCVGIPIGQFLKRCNRMAGLEEYSPRSFDILDAQFVAEQAES